MEQGVVKPIIEVYLVRYAETGDFAGSYRKKGDNLYIVVHVAFVYHL